MSPDVDVVGVGANSIDFVYTLPVYPEPSGERAKLRVRSARRSPGGQTATVLAACAALGRRTRYVGTISRDDNGQLVRDALSGRGVDLSGALLRDAPNAYAVILLAESEAERIVLWDRPAGMALEPADLPDEVAAGAKVMFVDDVDGEAAVVAASRGRRAGIHVVSDIEAVSERTEALMAAVTVPIFAEHVPRQLTGEGDPERALRALRQRHEGPLCVTLGERGAALLWGQEFLSQPAVRVEAVDTTGAGDVFRAGFIHALLDDLPAAEILRFACAAAAASCTKPGAISGVPTLSEVRAVLRA